jgi:hypothetical protein
MNKKTKMLLGVGVVAVAAYYFWNKSKETNTTSTASLVGADGVFGGGVCTFQSLRDGRTKRGVRNENGCQSLDGDSRHAYRVSR